ncbi:LPS assembly protein LptD [Parashewanella tropica]|uniref:LPS assembly protein LptD n=1 Tax=Parashewanella tropica TaxID=2547970 RepID=UPI001059B122|nr:LPS assembly protein LptD [Parashewanella tropica]
MNFRFFLVLSLTPTIVFAQQASKPEAASTHQKTDESQCLILPPTAPRQSQAQMGITNNHIWIESDHSDAQMGKKAHFSGGVTFSQGPRHIYADEATVNSETQQLSAKGDLTFEDPQVTITADSIVGEMKNNSAKLEGAQYWLKGQQVHGEAKQLEITPENDLILNNSSFTTCPPESRTWALEADKIKIDSKDEWGEVWGAKLKIGDVPIMYVPYMTIPVSDKRKSGLLFPKFSTSTVNGVELALPIYWNISPEYDLTFTPDYMSNRGLLSKLEFRYLMPGQQNNNQNGQLNVEYLPSDDYLPGNPNRYLYHWEHQGRINENLRVLTNFTDVSDNNYLNDFNSDVQQATDNQLVRVGELNYLSKDWDLGLKVQDIKVLGLSEKPYQVMPQVSFDYRFPELSNNINFDVYSEVTNFSHDENSHNTATRLHIEPRLLLPLYGPAGSFTTEIKLYQTNYWQRNAQPSLGLAKRVSRTIPSLRLHGQINLERDTQLFDHNYRQTFEPQIQYLYVGYENQSNIALYDTAQLQEDYYGLFRDRRYSGIDRIADANQVTIGLTSRLYDENNREKLKFSFGQIFYLKNSRVGLLNNDVENQPSSSVLAAELDSHIYNDWYLSTQVQYDTKLNETRKHETSLDFRPAANKLFQLSYRYVPDLLNSNTNNKVNIAQAGTRIAWPIKKDLYFVGNWYYDFKRKRSIETFAGVQYESCCWAARLSYHYRIKTNFNDNIANAPIDREQFESGIYLNFMIRGLGGAGSLGVSDMLNESIFNYRKPIYLTD